MENNTLAGHTIFSNETRSRLSKNQEKPRETIQTGSWEVLERERSYLRIISEVLERGSRLGVFKFPDPGITILVNILPLTSSAWALRSWNLGRISKSEYTEALIAFVLQGIGAVKGKALKGVTTRANRTKRVPKEVVA